MFTETIIPLRLVDIIAISMLAPNPVSPKEPGVPLPLPPRLARPGEPVGLACGVEGSDISYFGSGDDEIC